MAVEDQSSFIDYVRIPLIRRRSLQDVPRNLPDRIDDGAAESPTHTSLQGITSNPEAKLSFRSFGTNTWNVLKELS